MKLALIGGGSVRAPEFVRGALAFARDLDLQELWLMDADPVRLERMTPLCAEIAREAGAPFRVLHTQDLDDALRDVDLAIVHEWNGHDLVRALGRHRQRRGGYRLLFHDTHHRSLTAPKAMAGYSLCHYDGVLAFGSAVRDRYLEQGWALRAWTWHEAADTRLFYPRAATHPWGDLVWIGNWGDGERTRELNEFLLRPVAALGLRARAYGVRYPAFGRDALARARIGYGGWLANHAVPEVLAHYRVTVHVPRAPYARALTGIPTIRVFEALACGVPLVCSPWEDSEGLFRPGEDYLVARDGNEMAERLHAVLSEEDLALVAEVRGDLGGRPLGEVAHGAEPQPRQAGEVRLRQPDAAQEAQREAGEEAVDVVDPTRRARAHAEGDELGGLAVGGEADAHAVDGGEGLGLVRLEPRQGPAARDGLDPGRAAAQLAQQLLPGVLEVGLGVGDDPEALDAHARAVEPHAGGDAVALGGGVRVGDALLLDAHQGRPGQPGVGPDRQEQRQRVEAERGDHAPLPLTWRTGGRPLGGRPGRGGVPRAGAGRSTLCAGVSMRET